MSLGVSAALEIGAKLLDKFFPDPEQKAQAKLRLLELERDGELKEMELQLSAIVAEAQSKDKWTSRARPSFLYVVYVLILGAIPMGILTVFNPEAAYSFTVGFQAWLEAIPEHLIWLFGTVMLGYTGARTYEKAKGLAR